MAIITERVGYVRITCMRDKDHKVETEKVGYTEKGGFDLSWSYCTMCPDEVDQDIDIAVWINTEEEHYCACPHCREQGSCAGCTSGVCP